MGGMNTCDQGNFQYGGGHIENHAAENKIYASGSPVDHLVQCTCLSRQVESEVQLVQMSKHLGSSISNCSLSDLQRPCYSSSPQKQIAHLSLAFLVPTQSLPDLGFCGP